MKKVEVYNLFVGSSFIWIKTKRSSINSGRRLHPCQSTEQSYKPIEIVKGIRIGDIVRSDTLPFMSRPQSIWEKDENGWLTRGKDGLSIRLYKPFKLESGYWVLRKVV